METALCNLSTETPKEKVENTKQEIAVRCVLM